MMEAELSFEELLMRKQEELLAKRSEERAKSRADIPERALIWLALPPLWTLELAEKCSFPTISGNGVHETLQRIYKERLCDCIPAGGVLVIDESTGNTIVESERYYMSSSTSTEILQRVVRDTARGLRWLQDEMEDIGEAILHAKSSGVGVLDEVERWAKLAKKAKKPKKLVQDFNARIDELLKAQQSGEVSRWIESARPLGELLGGELAAAVRRASRRLDLFHRRADDKRYLARFVARDDQIDAFKALLKGPDDLWGLHYVGDGGTGKTMLARHLTSRLAEELNISVARIDFDYLNPEFPLRQPGLLMQELAVELRLQDERDETESIARQFVSFDQKLLSLHERSTASSNDVSDLLRTLASRVKGVVQAFAEAAEALPKQPVVLILDTCEELAKLRPDGTVPESVQATFTIFELLHSLLPTLRVVFCGRRPLAAKGVDWQYRNASHLQGTGDANKWWNTVRPYLRLHEIRGFPRDVAERFLLEKFELPSQLVDPILQRSLDPAHESLFKWDRPEDQSPQEDRYNPFDLALYAAWVKEEPRITPQIIQETEGDRYVEMRIVARNPALRPLLPAVALLGRFEKETLRTAWESDLATFEKLFLELVQQEWIDRQQSQFFEVKRGLLPRLRKYYQQAEPGKLEASRRSIAAYLEEITREQPLSKLDISYFDIMLRLLEKEPEHAASWWSVIEARIAREGAYDWMKPATEFLLSSDGAAALSDLLDPRHTHPESRLRAAVVATHAAVLIHARLTTEVAAWWVEVEQKADQHPDPQEAQRLKLRALAGQIAVLSPPTQSNSLTQSILVGTEEQKQNIALQLTPSLHFNRSHYESRIQAFWEALVELNIQEPDELLMASFAAAIEAVLEYCESFQYQPPDPAPLLRLATSLVDSKFPTELQAFIWILTGRLLTLDRKWGKALEWFRRALQMPLQSNRQMWLDWRTPDSLSARIRLEFIRAMYPTMLTPAAILAEVGDQVPEQPGNIDDDRLAAAILTLRGATSLMPEIEQWSQQADTSTAYVPTCHAHRAFPPFFAVLAETVADCGQVDAAIDYLTGRAKAAEQSANDLETLHEADRAKLRVVRRMRLRDEGYGLTSSLISSSALQDWELQWALQGLDWPKTSYRAYSDSLGSAEDGRGDWFNEIHVRWRTRYIPEAGAVDMLRWISQAMSPSQPVNKSNFAYISCLLDQWEASLLANWQPFSLDSSLIAQWFLDQAEHPLETLIFNLRTAALSDLRPAAWLFVEHIGKRRAAEIALDEGELLALRLPANALFLLQQARDWFVEVEDYSRAVIAGTCAALVLIRLRRTDDLQATLTQIQQDYQCYLRQVKVALPTLETLEAIAENPTGEDLNALRPRGWRAWLVRLITCIVWQKDGAGRTEQAHHLAAWLRANYGAIVSQGFTDTIALAADLDGLLESGEEALTPTSPSTKKITVDIRAPNTGLSLAPIEIPIPTIISFFDLRSNEEKRVEVAATISGTESYREAAMRLLQETGDLLRPLWLQMGGNEFPRIALRLDPIVSGICWEGLFVLALPLVNANGEFPWEQLQLYRLIPKSRTTPAIFHKGISGIVSWIDNTSQEDMARSGWKLLAHDNKIPHFIMYSWEIRESSKSFVAPISVLHLVGNPVETSYGMRHQSSSYGSVRGADLLRVEEELPALFPDMVLCILQAPTQEMFSYRTTTDRAQIGNLRSLAAAIFQSGVPVVVTIPPLPSALGAVVLDHFAGALHQENWKEALFDAIHSARLSLLGAPELQASGPDLAQELALDICLYASEDLNV
jgi:hypothetical protein